MTITPANRSLDPDHVPVPYTVLSLKAILWSAVVIVAVGIGLAVWLLLAYRTGDTDANRNQLDAIRTAGTIVVGSGGAVALLLAARRQRSTEIALKQKEYDQRDIARAHALQEQVAEDVRQDAAERRITDQYTRSVEQLGSNNAPVRLGGLYALERLAQNVPTQRQTIVNVLCAYLRMPYDLPGTSPEPDADKDIHNDYRSREQERQVRFAAQRILTNHLRPAGEPDQETDSFWPGIDLDLTGATLTELDLNHCHLRTGRFSRAHFTKHARFDGATFTGTARFAEAVFGNAAQFEGTHFSGDAWFTGARFAGTASFAGTRFAKHVSFRRACFTQGTPDPVKVLMRASEDNTVSVFQGAEDGDTALRFAVEPPEATSP